MRIVIERIYPSAEAACCQAEEPAARSDVEESRAVQIGRFEHILQGTNRLFDFGIGQRGEKPRPILSELKALSLGYLGGVRFHQQSSIVARLCFELDPPASLLGQV